MNHKRRRPKHQRSGCTCKWWKFLGNSKKALRHADAKRVSP